MFNNSVAKLIGVAAILGTGLSIADDVTIPNTFQAGTPARAADVNANFTAVEASVDDNAADIANNVTAIQTNTLSIAAISSVGGVGVYSGGVRLGAVLVKELTSTGKIWVLSSQGYLFEMGLYGGARAAGGHLGTQTTVYYSELNCQGRAFIVRPNSFPTPLGFVFRVGDGPPVIAYYTPRDTSEVIENQLTESYLINGISCQTRTETQSAVFEVFPNDQAITGVSETPPAGAIQLGLP